MTPTVVALCSASGSDATNRSVGVVATRVCAGLGGRSPDDVVRADDPDARRRIAVADLLVIGTAVTAAGVDPAVATVLSRARGLAGTIVVLVAVGPWPAEANTIETHLRPIILRAGAKYVSPALVVDRDSTAATQSYCRHWRLAVANLMFARGRVHTVPHEDVLRPALT